MTAAIVLGSIAFYLLIGFVFGKREIPYFLADQRSRYPTLYATDSDRDMKDLHREAAGWVILWIFFWPFMFMLTRSFRSLAKQVATVDPKFQAMQTAKLQKRIAELERELDMH